MYHCVQTVGFLLYLEKRTCMKNPRALIYLECLETTHVASAYPVHVYNAPPMPTVAWGRQKKVCAVTIPGQPEAKASVRLISQVSSFLGGGSLQMTQSVTAVLTCTGACSVLASGADLPRAASPVFICPGSRCCYSMHLGGTRQRSHPRQRWHRKVIVGLPNSRA